MFLHSRIQHFIIICHGLQLDQDREISPDEYDDMYGSLPASFYEALSEAEKAGQWDGQVVSTSRLYVNDSCP